MIEKGVQTEKKKIRNVKCQANIRVANTVASKNTQTMLPRMSDASTFTEMGSQQSKDQGTQCMLAEHWLPPSCSTPVHSLDSDSEHDESYWKPEGHSLESESQSESEDEEPVGSTSQYDEKERKFIVFESCLLDLLSLCQWCGINCRVCVNSMVGSTVTLSATCICGFTRLWNSQPVHGKMPLGNLILAAGVLFSGSNLSKVLQYFHHVGVQFMCIRTYNYIQSAYLIPSVHKVWRDKQETLLRTYQGTRVVLGGDGRCDSPGFCAKYGSYSCMDLKSNKILVLKLVQSNEVKNSCAMELEGLKRCFAQLLQSDIDIERLVTDRHCQIKKYMREQHPDIQHQFDVWHVAKGISKKILAAGKKKDCQLLVKWAQAVSNHVYWCAASSNGEGHQLKAKWLSLMNHVSDVHEGHGDLFPTCEHDTLEPRKWIKKDSKAHSELSAIVESKYLLTDIVKLSHMQQTSCLESFHRVVNLFAPKSTHFFYEAMQARLLLAVLHFNENGNNAQRVVKDGERAGESMWRLSFPKSRNAEVIKAIKSDCTYDYAKELMQERMDNPTFTQAMTNSRKDAPESLASSIADRIDKQTAVDSHVSRFNLCLL